LLLLFALAATVSCIDGHHQCGGLPAAAQYGAALASLLLRENATLATALTTWPARQTQTRALAKRVCFSVADTAVNMRPQNGTTYNKPHF